MSDKPLVRTVDADGFGRMRELLARPIDPVVVALNTRIVAQPDAASDGVTRSLLVFELGGERFAIEAEMDAWLEFATGFPVRIHPEWWCGGGVFLQAARHGKCSRGEHQGAGWVSNRCGAVGFVCL